MADEAKTERVQLMMTPSEVRRIDDWSFANRVRGRSEAIRQLIELGLNAPTAASPAAAGPRKPVKPL
jgi:hypothetical protein